MKLELAVLTHLCLAGHAYSDMKHGCSHEASFWSLVETEKEKPRLG